MSRVSAATFLVAAFLVAGAAGAQDAALALRTADSSVVFWRASEAPRRWAAPDARLAAMLEWKATVTGGVEWAEFPLQGQGEARFTRIVVVRMDPRAVRFSLVHRIEGGRPAWGLGRAPADAVVALNAGMFTGAMPWGWLVQDGRERLAPGRGPLSSAFIVTRDGGIEWVDGDSLGAPRAHRDVAFAFQSYPTLLTGDGTVPDHAAISRTHRDARLAIGLDREGRVMIALTRFDALGGALDRLPLGLTVPEMSALMGALGARRAMLLDGGISAQLLIRTPGRVERFSGSRKVPLALLVRGDPRPR